jgi:choline-sulfatase
VDPPQLYDLNNDPDELKNLIEDPTYEDIAQSFKSEVLTRWDSEVIRTNVIATQKQRRGIHAAMEAGILHSWDYNPPRDASNEFVRNHMDWLVAQETKRHPPHQKNSKK